MAAAEPDPREQAARAYLREQLGDRAPSGLIIRATFSETPLQGEGTASLFSFTLPQISAASICAAPGEKSDHYVVAGETTPNYFPTYDLDPDDGYSLHIGTRFMLEIGIGRIAEDHEPAGARAAPSRSCHSSPETTFPRARGVTSIGSVSRWSAYQKSASTAVLTRPESSSPLMT